eukprot:2277893-Prymnesium_polylepis.1
MPGHVHNVMQQPGLLPLTVPSGMPGFATMLPNYGAMQSNMMPPMPPPQFAMQQQQQQQQPATFSGLWSGVAAAPLSDNADGDEKKTVNCPYCGGRAINLGGSKRDTKYTYACEEPACQQRWNQLRKPGADGDLDITSSKRAIGNEPRRS